LVKGQVLGSEQVLVKGQVQGSVEEQVLVKEPVVLAEVDLAEGRVEEHIR